MNHVILNPNSNSNPSAMFRVVPFDKWRAYVDHEVSYLDVKWQFTNYADAERKRDELSR